MPRRKPVARDSGSGQPSTVEADNLAELLSQAKVPQNARPACIEEITQLFDWYNSTIASGKTQNAASQAESLSRLVKAAKALHKELGSLTPALRYAVEPDYLAHVQNGFAQYIASKMAFAFAAEQLAQRDPDPQFLADQTASLPLSVRRDVENAKAGLLVRCRAPLPLELILPALIETAKQHRDECNARVSKERTRRLATLARNELALNLRAIVTGHRTSARARQRNGLPSSSVQPASAILTPVAITKHFRRCSRGNSTPPAAFGVFLVQILYLKPKAERRYRAQNRFISGTRRQGGANNENTRRP